MIVFPSLSAEELWKRSRSGARAGRGFRFQDAAATAAAILCWAGRIEGNAVVPESFDDFAIETKDAVVYVQTKSKASSDREFSFAEIAAVLSNPPKPFQQALQGAATRVVLIDRAFEGRLYQNWDHRVANDPFLAEKLKLAIATNLGDNAKAEQITSESGLISWVSPVNLAAGVIATQKKVPFGVALCCVHRLIATMGARTDANAGSTFDQRSKVTVGEVEIEIAAVLSLIDWDAIEAAFRKGVAEHIDFGTPLNEDSYYLGVATQAGHVAAGLTSPRDDLISTIVDALFRDRRVLITGASGSGKSAAALMTAFQTRHAFRWIQLNRCATEDHESLRRFLIAQAPNATSPVVLYLDDAGGGSAPPWQFALEVSMSIPFVFLVATAREENLAVLAGREQFTAIRPVLDPAFAETMWRQLKEGNATTWISWQEPLERSQGLLLEYAHILTQGRRLHEVIADQVRQRLNEKRDSEFEVLRLTSAAASLGASVRVSLLADHLQLTPPDCARALQRLLDEHLIRRAGEDDVFGLHELRSKCIFECCLTLAPGSVADARRDALSVVSPTSMRVLAAAAMRLGQLVEADIVSVVVTRLKKKQEPTVLVGALEGLKLSALDRDAETFKKIADKHGIAPRFYFLVTIVMLTGQERYEGSKLEVLAKVRDEFLANRGSDFRNKLLSAIDCPLFQTILTRIDSFDLAFALLRSLAGLELGAKLSSLGALSATLRNADLTEIASALMIAEDLSIDLVRRLVVDLGGGEALVDQLWRATPWALQPSWSKGQDGAVELQADLLAVDGELASKPDTIVFEYASRMLALFPEAQRITSQPVQISGQPITVNGFSHGVKSIPRGNSSSQATITWNRLLLYAVALRYAAGSTTEVMQRRKESLTIAASQLGLHADRRCRGRQLTSRQDAELRALDALEDFFPRLPMDKPEVALGLNKNPELTDPASDLIADISSVCRRMYDASVDGYLIASDMESISKAVRACRKDSRWSYVGGAPDEALTHIEDTADKLREIFDAVGKQGGVPASLVLMPSLQTWGKGTGMQRAFERLKAQRRRKVAEIEGRLARAFSTETMKVHVASAPSPDEKKGLWPGNDFCMLVECKTYLEFLEWFVAHSAALQTESKNLNSLMIVPLILGRAIVPYALRIMSSVGILPATEFENEWRDRLSWPFFNGTTLQAFEDAFGKVLAFYAARELLTGKALLAAEQTYIERSGELSQQALNRLQALICDEPTELSALVVKFLADLNSIFSAEDRPDDARPAVEYAQQLLSGLGGSQDSGPTEIQNTILGIRMALVEQDMSQLSFSS